MTPTTSTHLAQPLQRAQVLPRVVSEPVLDIPLAVIDYERTLDWIDAKVARREHGYICVAAVHTVMACRHDAALREAVLGADLTVPDGQPLVWALNLLGSRLSDRVYGPELMERACARAARTGRRFYLYGGRNQGALQELARNLRLRHPGVQIVGGYAPPFRELTPEEEASVAADIRRTNADVVWVGIGVPKQEKWMARMRDRIEVPVMGGVGAAFDFHAGRISQAPGWMQERGLEWIYRIAQEPRRLLPRYLFHNPRFMAAFLGQLAKERATRS